ncbi:hypothetical protein F9C07_10723 [Aspergillus flavus]|uniref:Uncharacterized protein n=1 Tax=Aspergillus flavus (strain ATCC 200026 / FGSC A1120 / IAM 13836 / NRRL 3357 / JCM 12722 / SRRC 167) TaxID=332952 RepID=A0A7U2MV37_ASPFN|nr:hypothetical protein F9C07_10723 [Aspergillus flavus]
MTPQEVSPDIKFFFSPHGTNRGFIWIGMLDVHLTSAQGKNLITLIGVPEEWEESLDVTVLVELVPGRTSLPLQLNGACVADLFQFISCYH